jgi:glycosyltransferase involved in cell wall biosynthesis
LPFIEENYKRAKQFAKSFAVRVKEQIENKINNNEKLLTIGILSLNERKEKCLDRLLKSLGLQLTVELKEKVEVMVNIDDGEKSVGQKRNEILNNASGKFICFIDDDDGVDEEYIKTIIDVIENNNKLDCIGFSGMYYVNGKPRMLFKHANKYGGHYKDSSGVQHRPANHLNPVKTKIAQKVGFPEKNFGEDSDYCDRLFDTGLLKDEVILDKVMYHYYWASEVSRTH